MPFIQLILPMILASSVAYAGLISNSSSALIASMIISPILKPISEIIKNNTNKYLKNIVYVFLMMLAVVLVPIIFNTLNIVVDKIDKKESYVTETEEMKKISSFDFKNDDKLFSEILIALCVGIGIPFAVKYKLNSLLIAFAIAPSITPPLVNCGLNIMNYFIKLSKPFKSSFTTQIKNWKRSKEMALKESKNKDVTEKKRIQASDYVKEMDALIKRLQAEDEQEKKIFKATKKSEAKYYLNNSGKSALLSTLHITIISFVSLLMWKLKLI